MMICALCRAPMQRGVTAGVCQTCLSRTILNAKHLIPRHAHSSPETLKAAIVAYLPFDGPDTAFLFV